MKGEEVASDWRRFMRKHWKAVGIFVVAGALALEGAVYVFLWFVKNAQSTGLVPSTLGLWTMANLVTFILNAIFWELLFIGIPVVVGVGAARLWWRRLPGEERRGYHSGGGRARRVAAADYRCCSSLRSQSRSTSMVTGTSPSQILLWITCRVDGSDPRMGSDHLRNPHCDRSNLVDSPRNEEARH